MTPGGVIQSLRDAAWTPALVWALLLVLTLDLPRHVRREVCP